MIGKEPFGKSLEQAIETISAKLTQHDRWQETITTIAGKLGTSTDEAEILARLDDLLLVEASVKANGIFFGCSGGGSDSTHD